jgi:hypothetical protein
MVLALRLVFCMDLRTDSEFALYIVNCLVFITVVESVYSAVRTDCLYKADCVECFVRISEQTATFALYITN